MSNQPIDYTPFEKRKVDTQYHDLLQKIMTEGKDKMVIHGEKARRIRGHIMRFDMSNGFPIQTMRDMKGMWKGAIGEYVAFAHGATTMYKLKKYGCPEVFWKRWTTAKKCKVFGLSKGNIGPGSYGAVWTKFPTNDGRNFNQIENLIRQVKENPNLRTNEIIPWIPWLTASGNKDFPRKVTVAPCHGHIRIDADSETKTLVVEHLQRSGDTPVGVMINIIEYSAFGMMLAHEIGYKFTELVYYISDAHIYESQFPFVEELLKREPRKFPTVILDTSITDFFSFRKNHFTLSDYYPHPKMDIPTPT